jgi:hypothetical protein
MDAPIKCPTCGGGRFRGREDSTLEDTVICTGCGQAFDMEEVVAAYARRKIEDALRGSTSKIEL